ncbi:MAG: tetratricopeptide repeat protein, partial [Verrucomicrobiales bacterium]|nr:tetratricopeptide repeat protein [Verrucomicrobiales bacterium]
ARFEDAEPELDNHVETYPKSEFRESSLYFQASNMIKLLKWKEAAVKLDKFLEEFPDSEFLDVAYYDRANAHFALDEYPKALKLIELLKADYPESQVLDSALMLEGDIANFQENYPRAIEAYLAAKDLAVADGDEDTRANALSQLVGVSISAEKLEDAVGYYDEFIKDFQGTYYEPVTVVTAMPALVKVDRADEGLDKLEAMILSLGNDPASENLEKTVNTYARFYSDLKDPVSLVERLREMEKKVPDNIPLIAWLTIARIEILDDEANKDKFTRRDAQVAVAFQQLQEIPKGQLANYIKIKIATNLTDNDKEDQAEPWLQSVIDGASSEFKDYATLGLARVKSKSKDPAKRAEAKSMFERVISDYQTPELTEQAKLGLGRMYYDAKEYRKAIDEGFLTYMENKGWGRARAEVTFKIGRCYEEIGDTPNALFAYMGVVANYRGQLNYSAEAWYRAAQIQYKAGKQQDGFDLLNDMCLRMSVHAGNELDSKNFIRKALTTRDDWAAELGISLQELNSAVTE